LQNQTNPLDQVFEKMGKTVCGKIVQFTNYKIGVLHAYAKMNSFHAQCVNPAPPGELEKRGLKWICIVLQVTLDLACFATHCCC
jgi:hypothetical protein